jgi:phosphoserine phosphatase
VKLAIFDFDGTLFLEDTLPFLLKQWAKFGYSKLKLGIVYASLARLYVCISWRCTATKALEP